MENFSSPKGQSMDKKAIYEKREKILDELRAYEKTLPSMKTLRRRRRIRAIGLVVLPLLFSIGIVWLLMSSTPSEQAFISVYERYPSYGVEKSDPKSKLKAMKQEAFNHYETGNLSLAIDELQTLFEETEDHQYLFYKGVALLEENRVEEALQAFGAYNSKERTFYLPALYYTGLAHIRADDIEQARKVYDDLSTSRKYQANLATALKILEDQKE
ncbi:MAG: tetratricopeptide repeat protein [Bacteroidota bacterium]